MAKLYNTALGRQIDVEHLNTKNENVIAVGNMKTNARGDLLGPGGKVVKTRDQVMKEYYALHTPMAGVGQPNVTPATTAAPISINPDSGLDEIDEGPSTAPQADLPINEVLAAPVVTSAPATTPAPVKRGKLADSVAKTTVVEQPASMPTSAEIKKANGPQRF